MNIYESINKVMAQIGAIGKNSENKQQGFKYRSIDAIMNGVNPALIENKVFIVPSVLEQTREERHTSKGTTLIFSVCKIKFTFYAEDGTFIEAVTVGEGMDSGDKATNKAMAVAFKYACFQVFCIPTEELIDPESEHHDVAPKDEKGQGETQPFTDPRFITPEMKRDILKELNEMGDKAEATRKQLLGVYGVATLDDIPRDKYDEIMSQFKAFKEKKA